MARVPIALVDDTEQESLPEALERSTEAELPPVAAPDPGRHRYRRRRQRDLEEGPAFAPSTVSRTVRFALCVASLIGLAYATVVVLGLLSPGESEALGLPSRHPTESNEPLGAPGRPISVETENDARETTADPSPSASASANPSATATAPESAAPSEPPADEAAPTESSPADPPADDEKGADEDEGGKLIDVDLLGIRISI
ncbi:hypothetical protein [Cryptosporangium sp. NPDC051539]|uniref:hypothetical protein n=1 Tax=Cryptosporangium sp. NPDC051539 TaxID=3363962 RepID=UPI003794EFFD